ncbi:hypothetical protein Bpfe_021333 [Biomphalaria pfeifferi]|uniref:Uncharacterized protein n=1 Tax=Biomphalaria pfeifferi TaxID=112525 RepID=A0AAD8B719_BIOPF|nr:hypothetical protein Bpfe_021333 [Biomphalaria pfeifferi]
MFEGMSIHEWQQVSPFATLRLSVNIEIPLFAPSILSYPVKGALTSPPPFTKMVSIKVTWHVGGEDNDWDMPYALVDYYAHSDLAWTPFPYCYVNKPNPCRFILFELPSTSPTLSPRWLAPNTTINTG